MSGWVDMLETTLRKINIRFTRSYILHKSISLLADESSRDLSRPDKEDKIFVAFTPHL